MLNMKKIILYTSENCPYCTIAEQTLNTVLKEYQGLFKYKSVKIGNNQKLNVRAIPTIVVGNYSIEGLPEPEQIHSALFS